MKTAGKRQKAFEKDFAALLKKHKAELCIEDNGDAYCSSPYLNVCMYAIYDVKGEHRLAEYCEFELSLNP